MKIILFFFPGCSWIFRNVLAYSGMFPVPGFIDARRPRLSRCKGRYTQGVLLPEHATGSFCTCQYTRGSVFSSLNLPRELAPKYLTG